MLHTTVSKKRASQRITKQDVQAGDILLLKYTPEQDLYDEFSKLVSLCQKAVKAWQHWDEYSKEQKEEHFAQLMPLIHFALTFFDGDSFFHAAVVGTDFEGTNAVFEAGTHGINRTPLADYWDGPISVYRYHRGAIAIGDPGLPVAPVTAKAAALFADGTVQYGYFHAGLLAIWCLFREGEDQMMERLKAMLEQTFGKYIAGMLFTDDCEKNIKSLLTNVFHAALDHWRSENQLVCSEFVAACFNDADVKGTYRIDREIEKNQTNMPSVNETLSEKDASFTGLDIEAALAQMAELATAIGGLHQSRSLRSLAVARELVETDLLYTPHDLKASISTFYVGDIGKPSI